MSKHEIEIELAATFYFIKSKPLELYDMKQIRKECFTAHKPPDLGPTLSLYLLFVLLSQKICFKHWGRILILYKFYKRVHKNNWNIVTK